MHCKTNKLLLTASAILLSLISNSRFGLSKEAQPPSLLTQMMALRGRQPVERRAFEEGVLSIIIQTGTRVSDLMKRQRIRT